MNILILDIETNLRHDTIWCAGYSVNGAEPEVCTEPTPLQALIDQADYVVGHNLIAFDAPVLERCWSVTIPKDKQKDTLLMSRLYDPSIQGGHSLAAWGTRLGFPKGDFTDYDGGLCEEMISYCQQDIRLTLRLYGHLEMLLHEDKFSPDSVLLEHQVAHILCKQEDTGMHFDVFAAKALESKVLARMSELEKLLHERFPERQVQLYSIVGRNHGNPLKPYADSFNIGSRQQIAEKLCEAGLSAYLTERTPSGQYKVDETLLEGIDAPEAKWILEYLTLQKRASQIAQWFQYVQRDSRIRGRVITNGAVTGRMTHHSPNMAQIPNCGAILGKECRALFGVSRGNKLIGIDASGLELRMLAHYMRDTDYIKAVVEGKSSDGTDVHTRNQHSAGLDTRDQAKTFIYAFLYGAGAGKIGSIIGGGPKQGAKLINKFMENTPALGKLRSKVDILAETGIISGLDGRKIRVRSAHAALNTLLQGAGAVVMKKALVLFEEAMQAEKLPHQFVANVHDEWQVEAPEAAADRIGQLGKEAIKQAGVAFNMRCPLDGEYKVGDNWAGTH